MNSQAAQALFYGSGSSIDLLTLWFLDSTVAIKLLWYWRDYRRGLGLVNLFLASYRYLLTYVPEMLLLLPTIPTYGCWSDLVKLAISTPRLIDPIAGLFVEQLRKDLTALRANRKISTAAKWFPGNHSTHRKCPLVYRTLKLMGCTAAQLRKQYLSPLRQRLQLAERTLSLRTLPRPSYTRLSNIRYASAFRRLDMGWRIPPPRTRSILEVVQYILAGATYSFENKWQRLLMRQKLRGRKAGIVVGPVNSRHYPIALALSLGQNKIYTASGVTTVSGSLSYRVRTTRDVIRTAEPIPYDLTMIPDPYLIILTTEPLKPVKLRRNQRLLWWEDGPGHCYYELGQQVWLRGFLPEIFERVSKGLDLRPVAGIERALSCY